MPILNGALELHCPEGFHEMDATERQGLRFVEAGPAVCLTDPERHMIVSVGWKKPGLLARLMLNDGDLARAMEGNIARAMKPYGYRREDCPDQSVGGRASKGVRYTYTAQGIDMCGESRVVRAGDTLYYFNFYTRAALRNDNFRAWADMLEGVVWRGRPE